MSSTELTATEEADMAECDGDKVVTMMDVLQEQEDFEEDANAVLGASDEKNCTYPKGYIKRQALYACLTCCPDAKTDPTKRAGVCLACSLSCHENHELVELYTKRNFCCDCGNSKLNSHPCQFISNKPDLNENNSYNQNFSGLYCVCHRPYPDPEATFEDEMIQCIICEDWLHASHLEAKVPPNEQYSEMICKGCMEKNEFLYDYGDLAVNVECEDVDVTTMSTDKVNGLCNGDTHDVKTEINKENGDIDMADIANKVPGEENKEEPANATSENNSESGNDKELESQEQIADAPMEVEEKGNEQKSDENETVEQDNDLEKASEAPQNEDATTSVISEEEMNDSKDNSAGVADTDNNVDSKTADSSSEKPEKQLTENGDNETTDEQNSSISGDKLDSKTDDNTNSDEKVETTTEGDKVDTTTEGDKVEPTSVASEATQDIDDKTKVTKDEDEITSQSENEPTEKLGKQEESMEKDDLMESIDRIINGDDDESSKEKVETTTDSVQEKSSVEEKSNEAKENVVEHSVCNENNEKVDENNEKVNENNEKVDENNEKVDENEEKVDDNNEKVDENKEKVDDNNAKVDEDKEKFDDNNEKVDENKENVDDNSENKDVAVNGEKSEGNPNQTDVDMEETIPNKEESTKLNDTEIEPSKENKRKLDEDTVDKTDVKKPKLDTNGCRKPRGVKKRFKGATFWPHNFREKLCTCNECLTMYKDLSVLFLIDLEDTVSAYETLGKEKNDGRSSQYEIGLQALSSLGRIQQINALTEYNKMRDKLLDFLKSFKDRKEVVKEEDIKAFFAGMKPKREPDGVYFCR